MPLFPPVTTATLSSSLFIARLLHANHEPSSINQSMALPRDAFIITPVRVCTPSDARKAAQRALPLDESAHWLPDGHSQRSGQYFVEPVRCCRGAVVLFEPFERWPKIDGKDFYWLCRQSCVFTSPAAGVRRWPGCHDSSMPQEELMREVSEPPRCAQVR